MSKKRVFVFHIVAASVALALFGCGGDGKSDDPKAVNDLKAIGLAFHNFNDTFHRGPKDAEELKPYLKDAGESPYQGLKDGKYVFSYGIPLLDMQPWDQTILAYEKDVPTKGGPVVFADMVVKHLSAEEFKTAKLAKPKT
jgi:hypothetical protein